MRITLLLLSLLSFFSNAEQRIVSAGAGVTEILFALGAGDKVVAVDVTSMHPAQVHKLVKVGYHRQLSAEGLLSVAPDLLLGSEEMGPANTIEQLKQVGVRVESVNVTNDFAQMEQRIMRIGEIVGKPEQAKKLWLQVAKQKQQLDKKIGQVKKPLKAVFLLSMNGRTPKVAGGNTSPNTLIEISGAMNAAAGEFEGYKQVSAESLIKMQPDVILVTQTRGREITLEGLLTQQPGLAQTPAGKNGRLVIFDGTVLVGGMAPRILNVAQELAEGFYPELLAGSKNAG